MRNLTVAAPIAAMIVMLSGCLSASQGNCEWVAYSGERGFVVTVMTRTNVEKAFVPGWEQEYGNPAIMLAFKVLKSRGFSVEKCSLLGPPVMAQGGLVTIVVIAGDEAFVKMGEDEGPTFYHKVIDQEHIVGKGFELFDESH